MVQQSVDHQARKGGLANTFCTAHYHTELWQALNLGQCSHLDTSLHANNDQWLPAIAGMAERQYNTLNISEAARDQASPQYCILVLPSIFSQDYDPTTKQT